MFLLQPSSFGNMLRETQGGLTIKLNNLWHLKQSKSHVPFFSLEVQLCQINSIFSIIL